MNLSPDKWPPKTGVVIPAYKSADHIASFLPALSALVPTSYICVVDDGSRDGTHLDLPFLEEQVQVLCCVVQLHSQVATQHTWIDVLPDVVAGGTCEDHALYAETSDLVDVVLDHLSGQR